MNDSFETMKKTKIALTLATLLAVAGMAVTAYLIYQHYKIPGESFCNISDFISCDVVNKSIYSEFLGIPVSILGFLTYLLLTACLVSLVRNWSIEKLHRTVTRARMTLLLIVISGIGLLFSLYLSYIEFFVLRALCIFCLTQQILILLIFLTLGYVWFHDRKSSL